MSGDTARAPCGAPLDEMPGARPRDARVERGRLAHALCLHAPWLVGAVEAVTAAVAAVMKVAYSVSCTVNGATQCMTGTMVALTCNPSLPSMPSGSKCMVTALGGSRMTRIGDSDSCGVNFGVSEADSNSTVSRRLGASSSSVGPRPPRLAQRGHSGRAPGGRAGARQSVA